MSDEVLSAHWQVWAAECLLRGFSTQDVARRLVEVGLDDADARDQVASIAASPGVIAARRVLRSYEASGMVVELMQRLESAAEPVLATRRALGEDELRDHFLARGVPVYMPGWCSAWPAITRWSPTLLRQRVGDVPVEVCAGRDSTPFPDRALSRHRTTMTMSAFIDAVMERSPTNDLYMLARNHGLRSGLRTLLEDVPVPPLVDAARMARCTSLWFGPAGTITPAHHDTTSILFCQIVGRKRIWLASPWQMRLAETAEGFYAETALSSLKHDPEAPPVYEVVLDAGDALLIPAGWWHEVRSEEISISLSFTGFKVENRHDFYQPGVCR